MPSNINNIETLIENIKGNIKFYFSENTSYAEIEVGDSARIMEINSIEFKDYIQNINLTICSKFLSESKSKEVIDQLKYFARTIGKKTTMHLRVANKKNRITVNLAREDRKYVIISKKSWKIVSKSKAKFINSQGMLRHPLPKGDNGIIEFNKLISNVDDDEFKLLLCWILAVYRGKGPYPILVLQGEQGSGKSFLMRIIKDLCDPCESPIRAMQNNIRELMISAKSSTVLAYDNISKLSNDTSDALCSLATGFGFATRRLYTDQDEIIFKACRPIILNGITEFITKNDLADRVILVNLRRIDDKLRKTENSLMERYQKIKPAILADLFSAVSEALMNIDKVQLKETPRMADFANWSCAASKKLGFSKNEFVTIYMQNRLAMSDSCLEADIVAQRVKQFAYERKEWSGTATTLLELLEKNNDNLVKNRNWPRNPAKLSSRLREAAPALRLKNIAIDFVRDRNNRNITMCLLNPKLNVKSNNK